LQISVYASPNEEFVPAFEMDAFDSDVMAESGDSDDE